MHWICEDLHGKHLLPWFYNRRGKDRALFVPRGHIKTILFSINDSIFEILRDQNITIMVVSETDELSKEIGTEISGHLLQNDYLQAAFPDILPRSRNECKRWGFKGYELPRRRPNKDSTLLCTSVGSAVTGKHPIIIKFDDLIGASNCNPLGFEKTEAFYKNCISLAPPHGRFDCCATRWDDRDIYNSFIKNEKPGNQGNWETLVLTCWKDNDQEKGPIYESKKRWNSDVISGYTTDALLNKKFIQGSFFNAQYLNDPVPEADQALQVKDINIIVKDEIPDLCEPLKYCIETTGGGLPIFSLIKEEIEKLRLSMPLDEVTNPRGLSKHDRILKNLEPIIRTGRLYVKEWMVPDDGSEDNLGYEIRRLGAARTDDIVDCASNIIQYGVQGVIPERNEKAHLYLGADLAWSDKKESDWTILMALAVDWKENHWILDYDRFKTGSPTAIAQRAIEFYRRWSSRSSGYSNRKRKTLANTYGV